MEVWIKDNQDDLEISSPLVEAIARAVVAFEGKEYDGLSVIFVTKKEISQLHDEHFDDPSPTDCISFPMDLEEDPGYRLLGDVVVCPRVAIDYVKENEGDVYRETTLYLVHGLLHLMGYDDVESQDRKTMREAERRHLENLKQQGLELTCHH